MRRTDPMELRLVAARLATKATALLRQAQQMTDAHADMPGICRDCAAAFTIPADRVARFAARGWTLSTRCEACADHRRARWHRESVAARARHCVSVER